MAQRSDSHATPWLLFVLGALVAAVAIIAVITYNNTAKSGEPRAMSLNFSLPKAPELPQTPTLPPPPIPVPK